jgi:hypothetical protein
MRKIWCYAWAYVFVLLGLLDRLGDWMEYQVDNNNYLAGAVGALALLAIPYLIGVIDIVIWG